MEVGSSRFQKALLQRLFWIGLGIVESIIQNGHLLFCLHADIHTYGGELSSLLILRFDFLDVFFRMYKARFDHPSHQEILD